VTDPSEAGGRYRRQPRRRPPILSKGAAGAEAQPRARRRGPLPGERAPPPARPFVRGRGRRQMRRLLGRVVSWPGARRARRAPPLRGPPGPGGASPQQGRVVAEERRHLVEGALDGEGRPTSGTSRRAPGGRFVRTATASKRTGGTPVQPRACARSTAAPRRPPAVGRRGRRTARRSSRERGVRPGCRAAPGPSGPAPGGRGQLPSSALSASRAGRPVRSVTRAHSSPA